jgi:hypothetical protein
VLFFDWQVTLPAAPDLGATDQPQALVALFQECQEQWRRDPQVEMPGDSRLRSAFIDYLPWIADPAVVQVHQHLVTLAAAPGKAFVTDEPAVRLERLLQEVTVLYVHDLNAKVEVKMALNLRQVRLSRYARAPHFVPDTATLTLSTHMLSQVIAQASQRSNGDRAKPLKRLQDSTVAKMYGPMTARLLLSCVRSAHQPAAYHALLLELPQGLKQLLATLLEEAAKLLREKASEGHRVPQQQTAPPRASEPPRRATADLREASSTLRQSISAFLRALWTRSLMVESSPLDCPIHR